ncbi:MAG: cupin domain-containing protein [Acidobacteria bacterium]|nr:cupin domain-containing protein [Acidobacteriota bacterium]
MGYQEIKKVEKPWGYELIFAHSESYVGKILHIEKGHQLSLQYHNVKDETIYLLRGRMTLVVDEGDGLKELTLEPGKSYRIKPGVKHRMRADEACDVVEVSTPHLDDVVRLVDDYGRISSN